jgi:phospholipid/cholesterol/gamma-HCH transport system substrate-binding protein
MSKKFSDRNPVRLAIVGLIGVAVLVGLVFEFNQLPLVGNAGTSYVAQFSDASGLVAGEQVLIAGIKVGAVKDIKLDGTHVDVEFTVSKVDLGDGTTASIEIKSLLGQHDLAITPAGSGKLAENAVIPLARTSTPVNIVPAFEQLTRDTQQIDRKQIAAAFNALAATLRSTAPSMRGTLEGLSRLSLTVSSRDGEIQQLFSRAKDVSGVVAARDSDLAQLLGSTSSVLATLNARRQTIRQIITGATGLSQQLIGLIQDNRGQFKPALTKLNLVLDVLRKDERQLNATLKYGNVYAREFTNVGGSGRWFDASVVVPHNYQLCTTDPQSPLSGILDPLLSQLNSSLGGSGGPCLPLGQSITSRLSQGATR